MGVVIEGHLRLKDGVVTIWDGANWRTMLALPTAGPPSGTGVDGETYWDSTAKRAYRSDGVGWIIMGEPTINSFATTISAGAGAFTTLGTVTFSYHRHDGWLDWACTIPIVTNGTASGNVIMTFPIAQSGVPLLVGAGREDVSTGHMLQILGNGVTGGTIYKYDNTYPGGSGFTLRMQGRYQMATRYS